MAQCVICPINHSSKINELNNDKTGARNQPSKIDYGLAFSLLEIGQLEFSKGSKETGVKMDDGEQVEKESVAVLLQMQDGRIVVGSLSSSRLSFSIRVWNRFGLELLTHVKMRVFYGQCMCELSPSALAVGNVEGAVKVVSVANTPQTGNVDANDANSKAVMWLINGETSITAIATFTTPDHLLSLETSTSRFPNRVLVAMDNATIMELEIVERSSFKAKRVQLLPAQHQTFITALLTLSFSSFASLSSDHILTIWRRSNTTENFTPFVSTPSKNSYERPKILLIIEDNHILEGSRNGRMNLWKLLNSGKVERIRTIGPQSTKFMILAAQRRLDNGSVCLVNKSSVMLWNSDTTKRFEVTIPDKFAGRVTKATVIKSAHENDILLLVTNEGEVFMFLIEMV
jgi:hypothetical protein